MSDGILITPAKKESNSGILMIVDSENDHFTKWCDDLNIVRDTIKKIQSLSHEFDPKEHVRLVFGTEAYIRKVDEGIYISMERDDG